MKKKKATGIRFDGDSKASAWTVNWSTGVTPVPVKHNYKCKTCGRKKAHTYTKGMAPWCRKCLDKGLRKLGILRMADCGIVKV